VIVDLLRAAAAIAVAVAVWAAGSLIVSVVAAKIARGTR
jgi:hypothetical protein